MLKYIRCSKKNYFFLITLLQNKKYSNNLSLNYLNEVIFYFINFKNLIISKKNTERYNQIPYTRIKFTKTRQITNNTQTKLLFKQRLIFDTTDNKNTKLFKVCGLLLCFLSISFFIPTRLPIINIFLIPYLKALKVFVEYFCFVKLFCLSLRIQNLYSCISFMYFVFLTFSIGSNALHAICP